MQSDNHESDHPDPSKNEAPNLSTVEPSATEPPKPDADTEQKASEPDSPLATPTGSSQTAIWARIRWLWLFNLMVAIGTAIQAYVSWRSLELTRQALIQNERLTGQAITIQLAQRTGSQRKPFARALS